MNTVFLLMARYDALVVIPLCDVCKDFFPHLEPDKLLRKINSGEIALPLLRIEGSQKSAKGVHINGLAAYIDKRRAAGQKECDQLAGVA